MNILINKIHYPVTVLGFGTRLGIWLQGCSIHCKGCVSQDTWDFNVDYAIQIDAVLNAIQQLVNSQPLDGITISGGEPFDQSEVLFIFIKSLRKLFQHRHLDILVYSGYPLDLIRKKHQAILNEIDILIAEPYHHKLPANKMFRGSSNQTLEILSELGKTRYQSLDNQPFDAQKKFQFVVDQSIWFIGIPDSQTMLKLEQLCQQQGINLSENNSWKI